jgi:uncharacterized protein DUF6941
MRTNIAVFADRAEVDANGALLRLERPFNFLTATSFPATADALKLVIGLTCEPTDYGEPQQIVLRIVDPDGDELASLTSDPIRFTSQHVGYPVSYSQIVPLNVRFPREGGYLFEIRINGDRVAEVPLYVGAPPVRA